MIGCPFLAGFYSKDLIMEFLYISEFKVFLLIMMLISLFLTVIYSLRSYYYLFFTKSVSFMSVGIINKRKLINLSRVFDCYNNY